MLDELKALEEKALAELKAISELPDLQAWSSQYIGSKGKGEINTMLRGMGKLSKEERPAFGKLANEVKNALVSAHAEREALIKEQTIARDLEEGQIDISLPGRNQPTGGLHPVSQFHRGFYRIWGDMGFQVFRSRDVETDEMNFTMLNIPPHHPARDMQDTFYTTDSNVILRTHTSAGQIRAMHELGENGSLPIRVILPGMVYRNEQVTARSEYQFTQIEGIAVGRNVRMSDLKGTISEYVQRMFGRGTQVRFRASYFPFTEPSMEIDMECFLCGAEGCNVCKYAGWLEIGGSGMIHPTVLRNGGYDPSEWSGFAFGLGPERMTMLRHDIQDIRYFWGNDLRFLEQF